MKKPFDYQHMKRWTRYEDLFANDLLIWFCHVGGNHWGFIWTSPGELWISIYDPLYTPNDTRYSIWDGYKEALHQFLTDELDNNPYCLFMKQHRGTLWVNRFRSFDNWTTHPYGSEARQMPQDTVNCGVISLHALTRIVYGLPLTFPTTPTVMNNVRIQIGNSIATHVLHDGSTSLPTGTTALSPLNSLIIPTVWVSASSPPSLTILLSSKPHLSTGENCILQNMQTLNNDETQCIQLNSGPPTLRQLGLTLAL